MTKQFEVDYGKLNSETEATSAVSKLAYEVENANNNKISNRELKTKFEVLKKRGKFPSNLEYIDSHTDKKYGVTASAFLNKDTGKVVIGMTGTNFKKEALAKRYSGNGDKQDKIDSDETEKDLISDFEIGISPPSDKSKHYEETQEFIKKIKNKYDIDFITGHSLGGREAVILGMSNGIPNIVVYNPAPISIFNLNPNSPEGKRLLELYKNYKGNITRFVAENDELTENLKKYKHFMFFW